MVKNYKETEYLWNVAGEIEAAIAGISWALCNDEQIILISDYQGIQGWANNWKTNNEWSHYYAEYTKRNKQNISEFKFVRSHSKNKWNDFVDELAFKQLV